MLHRLGLLLGFSRPDPDSPHKTADILKLEGNHLLDLGHLSEAEDCYRKALQLVPTNPEIVINLGFVLSEQNRLPEAAAILQNLLATSPHHPDASYMLGTLAMRQNDCTQALMHFQQALQARPDFDFAMRDLVQLLVAGGQTEEALTILEDFKQKCPNSLEVPYQIGLVHQAIGQPAAAACWFSVVLEKQADHEAAQTGKIVALFAQGKTNEVVDASQEWVLRSPQNPKAHYFLGNALKLKSKTHEAINRWRQALSLDPRLLEAWIAVGAACVELQRWADAAEAYRIALSLNPEDARSLSDLAYALDMLGRTEEAIDLLHQAISIQPDLICAHNNLAIFLAKLSRSDEALNHLDRTAARFPRETSLLQNLACQLNDSGKPQAALDCLKKALTTDPTDVRTLSLMAFLSSHSGDISPPEYLLLAKRFGRIAKTQAVLNLDVTEKKYHPERQRIRVGFVSGDLRNHPVGYFLESFLRYLEPQKIELFAYPTHPEENELTLRIKPYFSKWASITSLSDEVAANLIYSDEVDILVDLSGHTAYNRLSLFAYRPSPIQVSWLGYWASTGVAEIDYFLADRHCLPPEMSGHFVEDIYYLPDTRMCAISLDTDLTAGPAPAETNGYPTFGCYQHCSKISPNTLRVWGEIFKTIPSARLRLQSKNLHEPRYRDEILARLKEVGVSPNRVDLHQATRRDAYLKSYSNVDILLDTFPFSGGTTTCDALWVGVPTLTLAGDRLISRQGAGFLLCCGQESWIAHNENEYIQLAVEYALQPEKLTITRGELRLAARNSPLFDGHRFAVAFSDAMHALRKNPTEQAS